jgi:2-succinyl-6-hydroxy-2,4-cyclohexadiene-1-carboxylate synthase
VLHVEVEGSGPRLVLVHGFTQTGRSWGPLATELARHHEVVRVDAPGHGRSAAEQVDMVEGARLLGEAGGRASYVGYSMGARLCLHLALADPRRVTALVLLGGTAGLDDPVERRDRRRADEALADELEGEGVAEFVRRWLAQPLFAGLAPEAAGMEARLENTVAGLAASLRLAGTGAQQSLWTRLSELEMPVLAVAGERDEKFRARAEAMVAAIGPNAEAAVVPGAGHAAHSEAPEAFLTIVDRFLDRNRAGRTVTTSPGPQTGREGQGEGELESTGLTENADQVPSVGTDENGAHRRYRQRGGDEGQ